MISSLLYASKTLPFHPLARSFFAGLLMPLGFAPFHIPGAAIIGIALFFHQINKSTWRSSFFKGLFFGLGFFGFGTSWIYISIHDYGHLNALISGFVTLLFLLYLSLFTACFAILYKKMAPKPSMLVFSAMWVLFEYLRSTFLSGFPWLLLGYGQFDSPLKSLLPIVGVYGVSFLTCFIATLLAFAFNKTKTTSVYLTFVVFLLISPSFIPLNWAKVNPKPISVAVIQANLSMRNKWDERLFWDLLQRYQQKTEQLLGTELIVMPESAIPLPPSYVEEFLQEMHNKAKRAGSAIMLGIPTPTSVEEDYFFNTLISLGKANGSYVKQHLVPFGEYIPKPFQKLSEWLALPDSNLLPGKKGQELMMVQKHPIATLICYELAYGDILRKQLPEAEWIVSISDDGWFGHSLALYQQLQMAQVLSLETARYQVMANNDGLSSVIDSQGKIVSFLPAFHEGILKAKIFSASGLTPWVFFGNSPALIFCALVVLISSTKRFLKRKVSHFPIAAEYKRGYS